MWAQVRWGPVAYAGWGGMRYAYVPFARAVTAIKVLRGAHRQLAVRQLHRYGRKAAVEALARLVRAARRLRLAPSDAALPASCAPMRWKIPSAASC